MQSNYLIQARLSDTLKKLNVRRLGDFTPHRMEWRVLCDAEKELRQASKVFSKASRNAENGSDAAEFDVVSDAIENLMEAIEEEKDARSEIGNRGPRSRSVVDRYADFTPDPRRPNENGEARGVDEGEHMEAPVEKEFSLKPDQRMTEWARAKKPDCEFQKLGVGAYLRSMAVGAKTDLEKRALAEGTDSSGGYTTPISISSQMIDYLRAESVCTRAGAQMVLVDSKNHNIAAVDTPPSPAWRTENGLVAEDDPTFRNVQIIPRSLAVMVKVSDELLQDSLNIQTELPGIMASAMATEVDRVCLLGTSGTTEPEGVANATGIGTTAHGAALTTYSPMLTARTDILSKNAGPVSAVIMHPRDEGTISNFTDTTGQPLNMPRQLSEIPLLTTTAIPVDGGAGSDESTIFVGNFNSLLIGMRQELQFFVSREYALDRLQYTFVAHMRMDVALVHVQSFHTITGVQG